MTQEALVVGIDVSKTDMLDVAVLPTGEALRLPNTGKGWGKLVRRLVGRPVAVVAFEATGGYERGLLKALLHADAGLPAARSIRAACPDFAKACGALAKNDRMDALIIAQLREASLPIRVLTEPDPAVVALAELVCARRQLRKDITARRQPGRARHLGRDPADRQASDPRAQGRAEAHRTGDRQGHRRRAELGQQGSSAAHRPRRRRGDQRHFAGHSCPSSVSWTIRRRRLSGLRVGAPFTIRMAAVAVKLKGQRCIQGGCADPFEGRHSTWPLSKCHPSPSVYLPLPGLLPTSRRQAARTAQGRHRRRDA